MKIQAVAVKSRASNRQKVLCRIMTGSIHVVNCEQRLQLALARAPLVENVHRRDEFLERQVPVVVLVHDFHQAVRQRVHLEFLQRHQLLQRERAAVVGVHLLEPLVQPHDLRLVEGAHHAQLLELLGRDLALGDLLEDGFPAAVLEKFGKTAVEKMQAEVGTDDDGNPEPIVGVGERILGLLGGGVHGRREGGKEPAREQHNKGLNRRRHVGECDRGVQPFR